MAPSGTPTAEPSRSRSTPSPSTRSSTARAAATPSPPASCPPGSTASRPPRPWPPAAAWPPRRSATSEPAQPCPESLREGRPRFHEGGLLACVIGSDLFDPDPIAAEPLHVIHVRGEHDDGLERCE